MNNSTSNRILSETLERILKDLRKSHWSMYMGRKKLTPLDASIQEVIEGISAVKAELKKWEASK